MGLSYFLILSHFGFYHKRNSFYGSFDQWPKNMPLKIYDLETIWKQIKKFQIWLTWINLKLEQHLSILIRNYKDGYQLILDGQNLQFIAIKYIGAFYVIFKDLDDCTLIRDVNIYTKRHQYFKNYGRMNQIACYAYLLEIMIKSNPLAVIV